MEDEGYGGRDDDESNSSDSNFNRYHPSLDRCGGAGNAPSPQGRAAVAGAGDLHVGQTGGDGSVQVGSVLCPLLGPCAGGAPLCFRPGIEVGPVAVHDPSASPIWRSARIGGFSLEKAVDPMWLEQANSCSPLVAGKQAA